MMDKVIQIVRPVPDSHFRLLNCKCGSDNVAYVQFSDQEQVLWRVECFDCERKSCGLTSRHEMQAEWNFGGAE